MFYGGRLAESQTKVTAQLGSIAEVAIEAGDVVPAASVLRPSFAFALAHAAFTA